MVKKLLTIFSFLIFFLFFFSFKTGNALAAVCTDTGGTCRSEQWCGVNGGGTIPGTFTDCTAIDAREVCCAPNVPACTNPVGVISSCSTTTCCPGYTCVHHDAVSGLAGVTQAYNSCDFTAPVCTAGKNPGTCIYNGPDNGGCCGNYACQPTGGGSVTGTVTYTCQNTLKWCNTSTSPATPPYPCDHNVAAGQNIDGSCCAGQTCRQGSVAAGGAYSCQSPDVKTCTILPDGTAQNPMPCDINVAVGQNTDGSCCNGYLCVGGNSANGFVSTCDSVNDIYSHGGVIGDGTYPTPPPVCINGVCQTAIGNIQTSAAGFVESIMGFVLSIVGGIAVILIIISGYRLMVSQGNPENIKNARDQLTAAIIGLLFVIFALVILEIIGYNILGLPGFNP